MFEKEAKEYLKKDGTKAEQILNMLNEISPLKITTKQIPFVLAMIQQTFQDGAVFGYNKANEWHKVKEEGLPINKNGGAIYLLFTVYGRGGSPVVAHFRYRDKQILENIWNGKEFLESEIIEWKECILPKESK